MMRASLLLSLLCLFLSGAPLRAEEKLSLSELCVQSLEKLPGKFKKESVEAACQNVRQLNECESEKGVPIFHFDKAAKDPAKARKILTIALIHGDEFPAGSVARSWMERLTQIDTRNQWRIIPVLNPDGVKAKTRYNVNGVDLNRNFPTKDWDRDALKYWEKATKKDKRRWPGNAGASEKETRCAMKHIEEFQPDLILSVHTPYAVLDFDGPKIQPPKFTHIPWKSLGNYPGSLGRYMWVDRSKPILTIELHDKGDEAKLEKFDRLQDISGDIAIASEKSLKKKNEEQAKESHDDGKK